MEEKQLFDLSENEIANRKKEILKRIAKDLEEGMNTMTALEKYKDEYIERTGTILTRVAVTEALNHHIDKERYEKCRNEQSIKAKKLWAEGLSVPDVADRLGLSVTTTRKLLHRGEEPKKRVLKRQDDFVLTEDMIEAFKDSVSIGDVIHCRVVRTHYNKEGLLVTTITSEDVKVQSKYRHFCETDKGSFRWVDLYIYSHERKQT